MRSIFIFAFLFFLVHLHAQDSLFGGKSYEFSARRYGFMVEGTPEPSNGLGLGILCQQFRYRLGYRVMPGIQALSQRYDRVPAILPVKVESMVLNLPVTALLRTDPSRGWWIYVPAGVHCTYDLYGKQSRFGMHGGAGVTWVLPFIEFGVEMRGQYVLAETDLPGGKLNRGSVFLSLIFAG